MSFGIDSGGEVAFSLFKENNIILLLLPHPLPGSSPSQLWAWLWCALTSPWPALFEKSPLLFIPQCLISVFSSRTKDGWWVWRSLTGSSIRNWTNAEGFSLRISQSGCSESPSPPDTFLLEEKANFLVENWKRAAKWKEENFNGTEAWKNCQLKGCVLFKGQGFRSKLQFKALSIYMNTTTTKANQLPSSPFGLTALGFRGLTQKQLGVVL